MQVRETEFWFRIVFFHLLSHFLCDSDVFEDRTRDSIGEDGRLEVLDDGIIISTSESARDRRHQC